MKIVFMGTSAFAVPILNKLLQSKHQVVAIYTKPPSKQNRGLSIKKSLIHQIADDYNIKVYTPLSLRSELEQSIFYSINADIAVVAAYGLIIPKNILNSYKFGFINVHPSDLPRWRGAAPIQHTMIAGDDTTGICIMKMDEGIDTGPIYSKKHIKVDINKNIHQLTYDYAVIGGNMLLEVLQSIESNNVTLVDQNYDGATYANKILDEKIIFTLNARCVHGQIMALTPNGYFLHNKLRIKVIDSILTNNIVQQSAGCVISKSLEIVCGDNRTIQITKLQKPGGKILSTQAFICGYQLPINTLLK